MEIRWRGHGAGKERHLHPCTGGNALKHRFNRSGSHTFFDGKSKVVTLWTMSDNSGSLGRELSKFFLAMFLRPYKRG
jgi:hypothetical protein